MIFAPQIKIPATYMRGGTSKGVFFKRDDLPEAAQVAGKIRDQILKAVGVDEAAKIRFVHAFLQHFGGV